jgi:hypothetical protein
MDLNKIQIEGNNHYDKIRFKNKIRGLEKRIN